MIANQKQLTMSGSPSINNHVFKSVLEKDIFENLGRKYDYSTVNEYCKENKVILLEDYSQKCMSTTHVKGKCLTCENGVFEKQVAEPKKI
jgi:hypothetical protein